MKKIILILSIVALALGFTGCKKEFLDTVPTNSTSPSNALSTTEGCMMLVNGIHRLMYTQVSYLGAGRQSAGGQSMLYIMSDHMGEDMVAHLRGNGWFEGSYQWVAHRNETHADNAYLYSYLYQIISNANLVIENIDNAAGLPEEKQAIKGEALCFRAFAHFWLVQKYAKRYDWAGNNTQLGVPLMLKVSTEPTPRSTVEKVYTQINQDLDDAIVCFTNNTKISPLKSHFNLNTANGLKARVALTQGKWDLASKHAQEAYKGKTLANAQQLQDGFYTVDNPDWIWGSKQNADQPLYFYGFAAYLSVNFNSTAIRTGPRKINAELYESMASDDIRRKWWHGDSAALAVYKPLTLLSTPFTIPKYGISKFRVNGTTSVAASSIMDVVHMRVSEMYLIVAEAEARLGHDAPAQAALKSIMEIRVPGYTTSKTGTDLLEEILTNRRIELWGEGFRWLDLKRMNSRLVRTAAQGHTPTLANEAVTMTPEGIAPDDNLWVYVFPRRELTSNPVLEQNP